MPGAQVFRFETQATTMRDTIGGMANNGQRFEFGIYPRRGGELAVPPAAITLLDGSGAETGAAQGREVRLPVSVPQGVDPSGPVVATDDVKIDERWEPDPGTAFTAGGAIVRTLTRTAGDVPGPALRDLDFPAPDGVRVYVDQPGSRDRVERGSVREQRTDRVTYVFERAGMFELPAVSQPWWDLDAGEPRVAEGAGIAVSVSVAPGIGAGSDRESDPIAWRWMSVWLALAGLGAVVATTITGWKRRPLRSGARAFRQVIAACHDSDPPRSIAASPAGACDCRRRRQPPPVPWPKDWNWSFMAAEPPERRGPWRRAGPSPTGCAR